MSAVASHITEIVVDHRERSSGVPDLLAGHDRVDVIYADLAVGDYVVDQRVVFERKTLDDFAKSIIDTRLFRQASRLRRSSLRGAVIIEGGFVPAEIPVPREAMQGALISLSLVFDIPVLRAVDKEEQARFPRAILLFAAGRNQVAEGERVFLSRMLDLNTRARSVGVADYDIVKARHLGCLNGDASDS